MFKNESTLQQYTEVDLRVKKSIQQSLMKVIGETNRRVAEIQIFEKTYLIVIKDETGLKFEINDSTLFLIGSYAQKLVASY